MTNELLDWRRRSEFFVPVPKATLKRQRDLGLIVDWFTEETKKENDLVNKIRDKITQRRNNHYQWLTKISRELLDYWKDTDRQNKLFFCQIEALETLMYITECADKMWDTWILNQLKEENQNANAGLFRLALKMATGSGKTVVMAMVIAWQVLNKIHYKLDTKFSDAFVIITPGVTIRDRLNVLDPGYSWNYYKMRDIVPPQYASLLLQAKIVITNYHTMELRNSQRYWTTKVVKQEAKKESPTAMLNRAFKSIKNKSNVIVINDEAHHCYEPRAVEEKFKGDEKKEAEENNETAKVWVTGLKYLADKIGVNCVIDMSATPFFLSGSWYKEGTLFPWVVSDFSLVDAIECGIVKIPRVPVSDNTMDADPAYRNLWVKIRDDLPKKWMDKWGYSESPKLPWLLETAIQSLYNHYAKTYLQYEEFKKINDRAMPPVLIVVCNNTSVSKMIYNWVAGYETEINGNKVIKQWELEIFRNEKNGKWLNKANTLIIDSVALESSKDIDDNFKKIFAVEIQEYQKEYRQKYPWRDLPTDKELLREVMNTVGKKWKLGENIKCVISVSMLTEGWDVNTVTHVLWVRAFSTQLLCEQVVWRWLRRVSYDADENGMLKPEYADVFGVPFSFIPSTWTAEPQPPKAVNRVYAIVERENLEIKFPRVIGYKYEFNEENMKADFSKDTLTKIENMPTKTIWTWITGEEVIYELNYLKEKRKQEVVYYLTVQLLKKYFTDKDHQEKYWLFNNLKDIVAEYVDFHVKLGDNMFYGMLFLSEYADDALNKIKQWIEKGSIDREKKLIPILAPYDTIWSTKYVDFITTKPVQETSKSHINYIVEDNTAGQTNDWEAGVAMKLEDMDEVVSYVKNQWLQFLIPYEYAGANRNYIPDFVVTLKKQDGEFINLIIEVTGKKDDKKKVKTDTAKSLWIPAVNNWWGLWQRAFLEIQDPNEAQNLIRFWLLKGFENMDKYASGLFQG